MLAPLEPVIWIRQIMNRATKHILNTAGNGHTVISFEKAGLTAILGCGFDPGVTSIFTAYAAKHVFDEINYLDIVDCNAGDHHKAFATNFNPEIKHTRDNSERLVLARR